MTTQYDLIRGIPANEEDWGTLSNDFTGWKTHNEQDYGF